ncbi:MAG: class I SAM-dependent methyltransferase [Rhodospirillaceae bacterium]
MKPCSRGSALRAAILALLVLAGCATPTASAPDYAAIVAAPDRLATDRDIDKRRDPVKLLAYTGVRPGMKVLDVNSGAGYTTELLSRVVGPTGVVYAQDSQATVDRVRDRYEKRLQNNPMKNVMRVVRDYGDPVPPGVKDLDLVTLFFFYHDIANMSGVDRTQMNKRIYEALKSGGLFVVADHSAAPGAGTAVTNTLHRIDEAVVRREVEAAGFQLVGEGGLLRNPEDPRDGRVFQSKVRVDEFVLKFRKP